MRLRNSFFKKAIGLLIISVLFVTSSGFAQSSTGKADSSKQSLYDRLGGIFTIAAVVDHFSYAVVKNSIVGQNSKNPALKKWHTKNLGRLPGLKYMRTTWVAEATGGPMKFVATKPGKAKLGLEVAHHDLKISPEEFDEVASELGRTLDHFKVPKSEKDEVLAAFAAHKNEVTAGFSKNSISERGKSLQP